MGAPLRKQDLIANDFYQPPVLEVTAASPRVVPFARLPLQPRRGFSLAVALAVIFVIATAAVLAGMVGAMLWFGHDTQLTESHIAATVVPAIPLPATEAKPAEAPIALKPELPKPSTADPADITLPAEGATPPAPAPATEVPKANDLQISMRDALPEDVAGMSSDAATLAIEAHGLERQGKLKLAIVHLLRAAQADPDNLLYRLDLAMLYDRTGQEREALALYRQVLDAAENEGLQDGKNILPRESVSAIRTRVSYMDGVEKE